MNELDRVWAQMISDARAAAEASGRADVAQYLKLKASNDAIRSASVKWLFDSMLEIAGEANRKNSGVTIENESPHRFAFGNSNLSGALLRFRRGVRCLTLEAGWTRTPADGFMRGGALAGARITHFGMGKANAELFLLRENDSPKWFSIARNGALILFDSNDLINHFRVFLGSV